MSERNASRIMIKIQRYDPEKDKKPRFQDYTVPVGRGTTILDCLLHIKENLDSTLTFRASCRMGICGSCGVLVNNYPYLACHTQVEELHSGKLTVKPLSNLPVIKDLVVDLTAFFDAHRSIEPYLIRNDEKEMENPTTVFIQTPQVLNEILQFANCIKCGLCLAACPTSANDGLFIGPPTITQCYRYCADSRDEGEKQRTHVLGADHGIWGCHLAGACSEACPKGVDPALGIQLMKKRLISGILKLRDKNTNHL